MPIFKGRKPTKKKSFGGKPGKPGRGSKFGGKSAKFGKAASGKKSKKRASKRKKKAAKKAPIPSIDSTGMEAWYLKKLMLDETPIVVVLNTGERVRGFVRYYDQDVFSFSPADGSPKMFLRKEGIRYLYEEPEEVEEREEEAKEEE